MNEPDLTKAPAKPPSRFIPFSLSDVARMLTDDGRLPQAEAASFQRLVKALRAVFAHKYHGFIERLKENFHVMEPDADLSAYRGTGLEKTLEERERQFFSDFDHLLDKANFDHLEVDELKLAFVKNALIRLKIYVDFEDFEVCRFYYRNTYKTEETRSVFFFFRKTITFSVFRRVVLLVKFKDESYFADKKEPPDNQNFTPGRTYIYYFKNVPEADLEALFPNIRVRMNMRDKLLFLFPTFWAALATLVKVLPNLTLLAGAILVSLGLAAYAQQLGIHLDKSAFSARFIPLVATLSSVVLVLGGFAVKQYVHFKNKWITFLKEITDSLFFRLMAVNASVFKTLLDEAVEEECKEALLAYYHLRVSGHPLTAGELDEVIETWFAERFDRRFDFEVEDALEKLTRLTAGEEKSDEGRLVVNENGRYNVPPPGRADEIVRNLWRSMI